MTTAPVPISISAALTDEATMARLREQLLARIPGDFRRIGEVAREVVNDLREPIERELPSRDWRASLPANPTAAQECEAWMEDAGTINAAYQRARQVEARQLRRRADQLECEGGQ